MTTVIIVRHGQSQANLEQWFAGQCHVPLTDLGHKQAELTAAYLDRYPIQHIYASDLRRAYQTAEHTANRRGIAIVPDTDFREILAGEWEGLRFDEIAQRYPESHRIWKEHVGRSQPDGGESVAEVSARVCRRLDELIQKHRGECFAVFTHAIPARSLACRWLGHPIEEAELVPFCSNASVTVVEYDENGNFSILHYGYDGHLGDLISTLPKGKV